MKTRIFYVYRGKSVKLNDLKNFVKKKEKKKRKQDISDLYLKIIQTTYCRFVCK